MKKVLFIILVALCARFACRADTWSDMLRAYKLDLSTLVRGNGYQFFRSEAGGIGIAYSEIDSSGVCHFSLAMVPVETHLMRWLPQAGANFVEVQENGYTSGVLALQEVKGPDTDPRLGSFSYVIEPKILVGPDGRILNLGYWDDKLVFLVGVLGRQTRLPGRKGLRGVLGRRRREDRRYPGRRSPFSGFGSNSSYRGYARRGSRP